MSFTFEMSRYTSRARGSRPALPTSTVR